ncbi:MAG: hypothetical protein [Bacteriophage sp.]|nr:MAG: hypothetical protein [Bacteriophage sp.]
MVNIIQIAEQMGDDVTFGELPEYRYIIDHVNACLTEAQQIDSGTTGSEFCTLYETLSGSVKNKLASVIDNDHQLRLDIISDLALRENTRIRLEMQAQQHNNKIYSFMLLVVIYMGMYNTYTYHLEAQTKLGDNYKSSFLAIYSFVKSVHTKLTNQSDN